MPAVNVPYSAKPKKINIKDLCNDASIYENKIITTTLYINSVFANDLIYEFNKNGCDDAQISFNTYGFDCKKVENDYITITGCVTYSSHEDDYFSIDIVALNNESVHDTVDESLFTDLNEKE